MTNHERRKHPLPAAVKRHAACTSAWVLSLAMAALCVIVPFTTFGEQFLWWPLAALGWAYAAAFAWRLDDALTGWARTLVAWAEEDK